MPFARETPYGDPALDHSELQIYDASADCKAPVRVGTFVFPNIITHEPEDLAEGPAHSDDAKILVEHHKRVAHGVDDGLRQGNAILDIDEWRFLRRDKIQHDSLSLGVRADGKVARIFVKWRESRSA